MSSDNSGKNAGFSKKHGENAIPNPAIEEMLSKECRDRNIPCAVAFRIAEILSVSPGEVGKTSDLCDFRLTKCQLGLFGYHPNKKIVSSDRKIETEVKNVLLTAADENGIISCRDAWAVAEKCGISKLHVGSACETMNLKIKKCQLGAF